MLDLDTLGYGEHRLLPLLQRNLTRLGIDDPLMDRFRGIRRFFWVRNLKAVSLARDVFVALDRCGVPFIVLKGAAIIACYLDDRSLRPMDDIDILVPEERLVDAIGVFTELNLRPRNLSTRDLIEDRHLRSSLPGWAFVASNQSIDLHWKAMHLDRGPHADDNFWEARREASLDGMKISVLAPPDQLLHTFAHAAQPSAAMATHQWPADAAIIIRGARDLCFDRVIAEAGRRRLSALAAEGLALLTDELNLPIPEKVVSRLRAASSWVERREMHLLAEGSTLGHMAPLIIALQDFRRNRANIVNSIYAFPEFLKAWTGVAHPGPAFLVALQAVLGWPSWLRQMLGRDRYRVVPALDRLPKVGGTLDLAGADETSLIDGWSIPEPGGRWTLGHEATVAWDIRGEEEDLTIRVNGFAPLHEKAPFQDVELWANDRRVASWRFQMDTASPLPARVLIPRKLIRNRQVLMLTFRIRHPVYPAAIDMSPDPRALNVRKLELNKRRIGRVSQSTNASGDP